MSGCFLDLKWWSVRRQHLEQRSVLLRTGEEIERVHETRFLSLGGFRVLDQLHQESGRLAVAARVPDHMPCLGGGDVVLADFRQPGRQERVPVPIRADAKGFQIPAVLAVMLLGQRRPKFGGFRDGLWR